jgi:hypothetical protein
VRALRYVALAALILLAPTPLLSQNTASGQAGGIAQILTADDVRAVLTVAATAVGDGSLAAAVVDRTGNILGVFARPGADERSADIAVSVARAGAMFANDQAPLSSRTVRFISGTHFPPGVKNTGNAALYGVENINRGCKVDALGDAVFNAPLPRPTSIARRPWRGVAVGRHHDRQGRRLRHRPGSARRGPGQSGRHPDLSRRQSDRRRRCGGSPL